MARPIRRRGLLYHTSIPGSCGSIIKKIAAREGRQRVPAPGVLEAKLRSQAHPQTVVSAIQERDIVANFGSYSDGTGKSFKTSARINRKPGCAVCRARRNR
jgi:hypothetical protein